MILCIDIGNTEVTIGVFQDEELTHNFRFETKQNETADEVAVDFRGLFSLVNLDFSEIDGICISSVVPALTLVYLEMIKKYFSALNLVNIQPGIKTGLPVLYDNPREIGADRIANSVGCLSRYGKPAVVVDYGTATTFDVLSAKGEYLGGLIVPGIMTSAKALFNKAARLSEVEVKKPSRLIGKNTVESLQSGLIYGTAALTDRMIEMIEEDLGYPVKVIATGGLAYLLKGVSKKIDEFDEHLTLYGLYEIYKLNS